MKKYVFLIILILLSSACGKENDETYINNFEYHVNDTINVNVLFDNTDANVLVCPTLNIVKDGEENHKNIVEYLDYNIDNLEVYNYNINELSEDYTNDKWFLKFNLQQLSNEKIDNITPMIKLKLKIKESGKYQIFFEDSNEECYTKYKDKLRIEITKE